MRMIPATALVAVVFAVAPVCTSGHPGPTPNFRVVTGLAPKWATGPVLDSTPEPSPSSTPEPTPSPTPEPTPSPTSSATSIPSPISTASPASQNVPARAGRTTDLALALVGSWACETFANWRGEQDYSSEGAGVLVLRNSLESPAGTVVIIQRFRFHAGSERWSTYVGGGDFSASGGGWFGRTWILKGVWRGVARSARLVYTTLGPNGFRRDFQVNDNGHWRTSIGETCFRSDG